MDDTAMMREALRLAQEAADDGEVPVGCVVAMEDGRLLPVLDLREALCFCIIGIFLL